MKIVYLNQIDKNVLKEKEILEDLSKSTHPHIIEFFDAFLVKKEPFKPEFFLIFEFCQVKN